MDLLLNWLWQGTVVALAVAALLAVIPRSRTQARYAIVCAACLLILMLPAARSIVAATIPISPGGDVLVASAPLVAMPAAWWTSTIFLIGLWTVWSVAYAVRLAVAATALRRARRQCRDCPDAVQRRLPYWSRLRVAGRPTRLVLSTDVHSAAVLGCGSPVIALAPRLLDELSDADLDRVLVHEWAHVQRRDDLVQLVQRSVRVVAGWHPALWWLERQLEFEREVACDEIVLAMTGSAKEYAACLVTLAALPAAAVRPLPAIAVSSSGLHRRIARILAARDIAATRSSHVIASASSVVLVVVAAVVGHVDVVESATESLRATVDVVTTRLIAPPMSTALPRVTAPAPVLNVLSRDARWGQRAVSSRDVGEPFRDTAPGRGTPEPLTAVTAEEPASSAESVREMPAAPLDTARPAGGSAVAFAGSDSAAPAADESPTVAAGARSTWSTAADAGVAIGRGSQAAGVAIGRGSQNAGVATGRFFTGFARKIAGSF